MGGRWRCGHPARMILRRLAAARKWECSARCARRGRDSASEKEQEEKTHHYRLMECAPFENRERCGSLSCGGRKPYKKQETAHPPSGAGEWWRVCARGGPLEQRR